MIVWPYSSKEVGMSANGKSYIKNVELFTDINDKDFSVESIRMHKLANKRDSLFWNKYRTDSLTIKEITTYHVIDSLGQKLKFDSILKILEKVALYKIPLSFVDIDLTKIFTSNKFEGSRLGIGLHTNERILKFLSIGGFFGYGLKDHQWKYGGEFILTIDENEELKINGKYQNTLIESGRSGLKYFNQNYYELRDFLISQMDRKIQNTFSIGFRTMKYAKLNISINQTQVKPQFSYEYLLNDFQKITNYSYTDLTVNLRYANKEKIISSFNQRISMGSKYPVLYISYTKGLKNLFNSEFDFNRIELRIEESFLTKNFGETKFRLDAGYIDKPLPYSLLFTGEGCYDKNLPVLLKNYFQTITPNEFLSDRYVNFHFSHNFSSLLFKPKKFSPHITLHQNIGFGKLSNPYKHKLIEFKTKEKGFYESGIQFDNIIKLNYLNIAYIGVGAGVYYRYGPYAYEKTENNLAIKFSLTFTTK
ncbi:MAG: hypothetical protein KAT68_09680 [Bacteroidales bacterium]|nr:hypothetical protein [Bacteroidales bacterium]